MTLRAIARGAITVLALTGASWGQTVVMDSAKGERLFGALPCVQCHSVNGKGGTTAPDLGLGIDRGFTPASLAATMWNHAPRMWSEMRKRNVPQGDLSEQGAADLFAYFYSAHFFDKPGDAGRGKRIFSFKHCADCHGLTEPKLPAAKPVSHWESIGQPVALVNAMWNHATIMRDEFARRGLAWVELTPQDLSDVLVYLRNLPAERGTEASFEIISGPNGAALFQSKGCAGCHRGRLELGPRIKNQTLTEIAVEMWNHEPRMSPVPPRLSIEEMRELIGYLWGAEFFTDSGNPAAGGRTFQSKHCSACHGDASSGAPALPRAGQTFTGATMVAALWRHGPKMMDQMQSKGVVWPRFNSAQMADLIGYLNSDRPGHP
jgi:mono/diheme cytochrome c family protein